ncbi:uncharacterized protein LOC125226963 [Leguminivora glycinivorella]|uniref:uncharacterized protein LOC125226963 n=1 Tax=Leguminivora glycinivorella TaxID=1035111 RepID=UPI0020104CCE|nr:uncharacterized protein LOC125226963 [Leguminivora glycinivorella]
MGSPVSSVVADIFMEDFEETALSLAAVQPKIFKRYGAQRICDNQNLAAELRHARQALLTKKLKILHVKQKACLKIPTVERQLAILPFLRGVTYRISHILKRTFIKTYLKPMKKMSQFLRSMKCQTPLQNAGGYRLDYLRPPSSDRT